MKKYTGPFIVIVILATLLYDIVAFKNGGTEATVSWGIYVWSYKYPFFPFCAGVLMGHLFWQMKRPKLD